MGTFSVVNRKRPAAAWTGPLLTFMLQKSIHSFFPDHLQVLKRRFSVRILSCIAIFFLHHIFTGINRAFITVMISVLSSFPAQYNSAVLSTKFRLMIIRTVTALTRIHIDQCLGAYIAIQAAWSNHICFKHHTASIITQIKITLDSLKHSIKTEISALPCNKPAINVGYYSWG